MAAEDWYDPVDEVVERHKREFSDTMAINAHTIANLTAEAMRTGDRRKIAFALYVAMIYFDLPANTVYPMARDYKKSAPRQNDEDVKT